MSEPLLPLTPTAASPIQRLFPTLTAAQIARIEVHERRRRIARGDVLVEVGDKAVPFFIMTGAVPNTKWLERCLLLDDSASPRRWAKGQLPLPSSIRCFSNKAPQRDRHA